MNSPLSHLRVLREHCVATIATIDELMALCPETSGQDRLPLKVPGCCEWVTQHALDRFRERSGSKRSDERVLGQMASQLCASTEIELKPQFRIVELMAHGLHARFFRAPNGMVFVVEEGVLVTAHAGTADRWQAISKK